MNKYTELSDFEINKAVAINIGKGVQPDECQVWDHAGFTEVLLCDGSSKDYCNSSTDAMPIIIDNNISLRAPTITDRWKAEFVDEYGNYVGYRRALNKNPLRAAMELFLLMKDAENENNNNS